MEITHDNMLEWVVVPLFIFFARICDVSLDTMRIININRDERLSAAVLGFFQILIWLFAIQQVMQNLTNIYYYLVYAGGFASGTDIGLIIQDKWVKGTVLIRIIADHDLRELNEALHNESFKATQIVSHILDKKSYILLVVLDRKKTDRAIAIMEKVSPGVFYSIQDIRYASEERLKHLFESVLRKGPSMKPKVFSWLKRNTDKIEPHV